MTDKGNSASRPHAIGSGIAVYDGRLQLGEVCQDRAGDVLAVLVDGLVLGRFPNRRAATDAILQAHRGAR